jgi:hypothetical protein
MTKYNKRNRTPRTPWPSWLTLVIYILVLGTLAYTYTLVVFVTHDRIITDPQNTSINCPSTANTLVHYHTSKEWVTVCTDLKDVDALSQTIYKLEQDNK